MKDLLRRYQEDAVAATDGLLHALNSFREIRDSLTKAVEAVPHGHDAEDVLLQCERVCKHLSAAAADVPTELWGLLIDDKTTVGATEVSRRMDELLAGALA